PDSPARAAMIAAALGALGRERAVAAPTLEVLPLLREALRTAPPPPGRLTIELSRASDDERTVLGEGVLTGIIAEFVGGAPGALLTLRDDAPDVARLGRLVRAARQAGDSVVHIRSALSGLVDPGTLFGAGADIISVDLPGTPESPRWYAACETLDALVQL